MACFVVPLVQAIATSALRKWGSNNGFVGRNLKSLELMLWGGGVMLIVDHIINGELMWKFPFLTAVANGGDWSTVLHEMLTVGVPMSAVLTLVWAVYALLKEKKTILSTNNQ